VRCFQFGFVGRRLKIVKVQAVTAALTILIGEVVNNAVVGPSRLAITIDFDRLGAAFYFNRESDSFHDFDA
jgi:hypothetical protein